MRLANWSPKRVCPMAPGALPVRSLRASLLPVPVAGSDRKRSVSLRRLCHTCEVVRSGMAPEHHEPVIHPSSTLQEIKRNTLSSIRTARICVIGLPNIRRGPVLRASAIPGANRLEGQHDGKAPL
jgi:hypothetical protein